MDSRFRLLWVLAVSVTSSVSVSDAASPSLIKGSTTTQVSLDFDENGSVSNQDLLLLIEREGTVQGDEEYGPIFDLDQDGFVGTTDVLLFISRWKTLALPRKPISPEALRPLIGIADGIPRIWELETRFVDEPPTGEPHQILASLEPMSRKGVPVQPMRAVGALEPEPKSRFLVTTTGDIEVNQVELTKDLDLIPGMVLSRNSVLLPSPVPLATSGMAQSGSTVISSMTATIQILMGPKGKGIPMDVDIPYRFESTLTDISESGDWSLTHGLFRVFAQVDPFQPFDGGFEVLFDGLGILIFQVFYTSEDHQVFESYRRVSKGPGDCIAEVEPNNDLISGESVLPPACKTGSMQVKSGDEVDVFRIAPPDTGTVQVRIASPSIGPVTATLMDSQQIPIQTVILSGPSEVVMDEVSIGEGETYFLQVELNSDEPYRYDAYFDTLIAVECLPETEPNNSFASANSFSIPGCVTGAARGSAGDPGDFFELTALRSGEVLVTVDYTLLDYGQVELFDQNQTLIQSSPFLTDPNGIYVFDRFAINQGDRIFMKTLSDTFGSFDYVITLRVLGPSDCIPEQDPGDEHCFSLHNNLTQGVCLSGMVGDLGSPAVGGIDFTDWIYLNPEGQGGNMNVTVRYSVPQGVVGGFNVERFPDNCQGSDALIPGENFTGQGEILVDPIPIMSGQRVFLTLFPEFPDPNMPEVSPFTYEVQFTIQ